MKQLNQKGNSFLLGYRLLREDFLFLKSLYILKKCFMEVMKRIMRPRLVEIFILITDICFEAVYVFAFICILCLLSF